MRLIPVVAIGCLLAGSLPAQESGPEPVRLGVFVVDEPSGLGVVVDEVRRGTPAARAGIRKGDRIVRLDETAIANDQDLQNALTRLEPGDTALIRVVRDGAERDLSVSFQTLAGPARTRTLASRGSPSARTSLERALKLLDDVPEASEAVEQAKREIRKALAQLERAPSAVATAPGWTTLRMPPSGKPADVVERVKTLSRSGRTPEEIEEAIEEEFPGVSVRVTMEPEAPEPDLYEDVREALEAEEAEAQDLMRKAQEKIERLRESKSGSTDEAKDVKVRTSRSVKRSSDSDFDEDSKRSEDRSSSSDRDVDRSSSSSADVRCSSCPPAPAHCAACERKIARMKADLDKKSPASGDLELEKAMESGDAEAMKRVLEKLVEKRAVPAPAPAPDKR